MRELIIDNFAGGGGASNGIELATGRSVDIAINHDPAAIAMHRANHPETEHYCESVWDVDPRQLAAGRPVGLVWLSPDCKHFSKAKGGKPVEKAIRGLAWIAVRWAATVRPRVIMLENVEEFKTWGPIIPQRDPATGRMYKKVFLEDGESWERVSAEEGEEVPYNLRVMIPDPKRKGITFKSFVNALRRQGYKVDWRELRACDYGAPTIRKRLFLVARRDGRPIVWPEPTHGDPASEAVKSGRLKPWRTAAEIIDWSIPCPSIFERARPLAENTMRRIARGIQRFVIDNPKPFVIKVNHPGEQFRGQDLGDPLQTVTAKNGWGLVSPTLIEIGYGESPGQAPRAPGLGKPLGTVVAGGIKHAVVAAFLAKHYGGNYSGPGADMEEPMPTVTTIDHNALVTAHIARHFGQSIGSGIDDPLGTVTAGGGGHSALVTAHITKFRGNSAGHSIEDPLHTITSGAGAARPAGAPHALGLVTSHLLKLRGTCQDGQSVTEPMPTITAGGLHVGEVRAFLLKYYGSADNGQTLDDPLHTITTKDRFGLVTVEGVDYQIVDIGMRMLEPHELFAAQGFPSSYIIKQDADGKPYSKSAQVARCGNSVPPPFAEALVRANLPELCTGSGRSFSFEKYRPRINKRGQLELSM